ncbi:hypothetical protein OZY43_03240 [Lactobacillus sp. ESL0785]|uniref:hypothetical protein n=1 Tax=Lactobacillus sp. ESL0785 TaxID=2983232 RepID=UPI0023F82457|nr:hypothetical protein [Lactobacillus sp. ESL0785]WEV71430.1 hypothetical protein OZY43_03240 [Lactobacillus sp. ESL0785]
MRVNYLGKRVIWSVFILTIYLLGQTIVLPAVSIKLASQQLLQNSWIGLVGMYTGAQTNIPTLFMLGIGPYMSANIVIQALTSFDLKSLRGMSQENWGMIINLLSLFFAFVQSAWYASYLPNSVVMTKQVGENTIYFVWVIILTAGSMAVVFLANLNVERGLGGPALLIVPQLLMSLPGILKQGWGFAQYHLTIFHLGLLLLVIGLTLFAGVAMTKAEEQIPLCNPLLTSDFARSYFPMRFLLAGAMSFMFASGLFMLPRLLLKSNLLVRFKIPLLKLTAINHLTGIIFYALVVIGLNFIFGLLTLQLKVRTRQLKESGDYFYHVVPGPDTEHFLLSKYVRLTWGSSGMLLLLVMWPLIWGLWQPEIANLTLFISNLFILVTIFITIIQQYQTLLSEMQYNLNLG